MSGPRSLLLFGGFVLHGVVDRIEGRYAVVEWGAQVFDVPVELFDEPVAEGRPVVLRTRPHRHGAWQSSHGQLRLLAGSPSSDLVLPAPSGAPVGRRYVVSLDLR